MRHGLGRHNYRSSGNPLAQIINALYGAGEQGIAVPDLTPGNGFLFQDSAGTTPVTAYEQPVGLVLDRSKGLVLGADVLGGAGSFSSATGWTQGTGWSIGSGVATATAGFGTTLSYPATLTVGSTYRIDVQASSVTGGTLTMQLRGGTIVSAPSITADGTYTFYLTAVTGNNSVGCTKSPTFAGVVDNFIVRELPGNHIIQATSTKRPTLSARYNLLTYTEDFSNAAWLTNNTVTGASGIAPNGTNTAFRYQGNGSATTQFLFNTSQYNNRAGESLTASVYLKYGSRQYIQFFVGATGSDMFGCVVDLAAGTITATGVRAGGTYTSSAIESVGNGWYRVSIIGSSNATNNGYFQVNATDVSTWTAGTPTVAANTLFTLIWGADLRLTIDTIGQPAYQRVGASNDYDTAGFYPYLAFDGTDDSMATAASVDFSATAQMSTFTGSTKFSTGISCLLELDNPATINPCTILCDYPNANTFASYSSGTSQQLISSAANYASPTTNVLTQDLNISAPYNRLRINGASAGTNNNSQGTGNYVNKTFYFGARNNASLFFNGRMYPFFIRGAATDAGLIAQVEQYIKGQMPVTF